MQGPAIFLSSCYVCFVFHKGAAKEQHNPGFFQGLFQCSSLTVYLPHLRLPTLVGDPV